MSRIMEIIYREQVSILKKYIKEIEAHYEFVQGDLISQIENNKLKIEKIQDLQIRLSIALKENEELKKMMLNVGENRLRELDGALK